MQSIVRIFGWLGVAAFVVAVMWSLLLGCDLIRRSKLPKLRDVLSVLLLVGVSLLGIGSAPILSEIAKHQNGERDTTDGVMYFVFLTAAGVALLVGVAITWFLGTKKTYRTTPSSPQC